MKEIRLPSAFQLFSLRVSTFELSRSLKLLSTGQKDSRKENIPEVLPTTFRKLQFSFQALSEEYSFARGFLDAYSFVAQKIQNILLSVKLNLERYSAEGDRTLLSTSNQLIESARDILKKTTFRNIPVGLGLKDVRFPKDIVQKIDVGSFDPVELGLSGKVFQFSVQIEGDFARIEVQDENGNRAQDTARVFGRRISFETLGITINFLSEPQNFSFSVRFFNLTVISPSGESVVFELPLLSEFLPKIPEDISQDEAKALAERIDEFLGRISEVITRVGEFAKKIQDFSDILFLNMLKLNEIESFVRDVNFDEEALALSTAQMLQRAQVSILTRTVAISSDVVSLLFG